MIWKGFRFGMLLQFAIGPVCLFIFQTAVAKGFPAAEAGVLGVCIADGAYILLALMGIGALLEKSGRVKKFFGLFGALILVLFGINSIIGAFSVSVLPALHPRLQFENPLIAALILTLSNPLSILFWAGVFTAKLSGEAMTKPQTYAFGAGAVLSTLFFLSLVGLAGNAAGVFLGDIAIRALNAVVGAVLIFFGFSTLVKTRKTESKI